MTSTVKGLASKVKRGAKKAMGRSYRLQAFTSKSQGFGVNEHISESSARRLSLDSAPLLEEAQKGNAMKIRSEDESFSPLSDSAEESIDSVSGSRSDKADDCRSVILPARNKSQRLGTIKSPTTVQERLHAAVLEGPEGCERSYCFGDEDAASDDADDGTERRIDILPTLLRKEIMLGGNSRAGWTRDASSNELIRKANQDSYGVLAPYKGSEDHLLAGVYDGHGVHGRLASQIVRDAVSLALAKAYEEDKKCIHNTELDRIHALKPPGVVDTYDAGLRKAALTKAYKNAEEELKDPLSGVDHLFSGTTGVSMWLVGQSAYVGWAGDSRAIIGRTSQSNGGSLGDRNTQGKPVIAVDMTYDQKPGRSDEKKRVRAEGGRVTRWKRNVGPLRVWIPEDWIPGLAMTRSVGDTVLTEYGVTPEPEVSVTGLGPLDKFIVLASDGVWEFMTSQEVVDFIHQEMTRGASPSQAASRLVKEAVLRWKKFETVVDDTTAVVLYLAFTTQDTEAPPNPHMVVDQGFLQPFIPRNDDGKEGM